MALFRRPRRFSVYVIRVFCVNQVICVLKLSLNMCTDIVAVHSALYDIPFVLRFSSLTQTYCQFYIQFHVCKKQKEYLESSFSLKNLCVLVKILLLHIR